MNNTITNVAKTLGLVVLSSFSGLLEAQTFNWSAAGPIYTAGRARNMVVDKVDISKNTLYVGSTTSGIFRSVDGGINWSPLNDQGTVRNISYLAQANDGTIYVATGEGFLRPGQKLKAQPGTGLYKLSGDNLVSVSNQSLTGTVINRIACHPTNSAKIALATNLGVLYSQDGGVSYTVLSPATTTANLTYGMDVKFDPNGRLYFTLGSENASSLATATLATKVYRTDANVSNPIAITPTNSALSDFNYGRIELAIAPSNPNIIYASCAKKYQLESSASLQGLFVSNDNGDNWGLIVQGSSALDPLSNGSSVATGDYSHVLSVDANNANLLLIGGYKFSTWEKNTSSTYANPIGVWANQIGSEFALGSPYYLHENIHDIKVIGTGSAAKYFFITDAGIYRSVDMFNSFFLPSFQPFYKGLVTGQFNSVSIESYPLAANSNGTAGAVSPYSGFIGGTGANGLTYFSGSFPNVTSEVSYLSGEIYNSEYSKILSEAAMLTRGSGSFYRTTNAKSSNPTLVNVNYYSGTLSKVAPDANPFNNSGFNTTGTPFKLWENYGQIPPGPDNAIFYNDSLRFQASMVGLATLTTQTTFTFSAARPNKFALIDSIAIRTGTVILPTTGPTANAPAFSGTDRKDLLIAFTPSYAVGTTTTAPAFNVKNVVSTAPALYAPYGPGPSNPALHGATLNAVSLIDNISITFTSAPFANKTQTFSTIADPAGYYRVYATVFYKYKAGDTIKEVDNTISTQTRTYTAVLTQSLNWRYVSRGAFTLAANVNTSIPSPTYVLTPGNISQSSPTFVVNNLSSVTYTISQNGTYSLVALPVQHTLTALNIPPLPTTYTLFPGVITQTTPVFIVTPTASTIYTITATNGASVSADSYSAIGASTYVLNPGNISQTGLVFSASPTVNTTYTLQGVSSNTLSGLNTNTTQATLSVKTNSTVGGGSVPFAPKNNPVYTPKSRSARLAMALNVSQITGQKNAIVVSKAPLSLNDPLNFVRVSQSGCLTDDAAGVATTNTISIPGKPTLIEWAKNGTELYYATDDNKLYRVSHITDIMDLSPISYSGKFFTDVFSYNSAGLPNDLNINPNSPYRTTLIGSFTKPITSISIAKNDSMIALTFNDPVPTGTAGIVMYNTNSTKRSNSSNIGWVKKDGSGLSNLITYCSLMERSDNKKVFIGTDNGIFYTNDISAPSPSWVNANNNQLPNVQIFDLEQQVLSNSECYNSGQIYVATNGRGIWTNNSFLDNYIISVSELELTKTENNISLYPNPTNGIVHVAFPSMDGESATINIFDLNGRLVKSENLGKINTSEVTHDIETHELNAGIYIIQVSGDAGIKRAAKLIVTK